MPDLGAYAFEVTLAYLGSFALLGALLWLIWAQARASKRRLDEAEGRDNG